MGYEQFHALLTAILMAGNLANSACDVDMREFDRHAEAAEHIMQACGFIPNYKEVRASRNGGAR